MPSIITIVLRLLSLVLALVSVQAHAQPTANTLSLAATAKSKISLPERISFTHPAPNWFANPQEHGLMPGDYVAVSSNETGIFYKGAGRPVWLRNPDSKKLILVRLGGIFVPYDDGKQARIYVIAEAPTPPPDWDNYQAGFVSTHNLAGNPTGPTAVGSAMGFGIVRALAGADAGEIHVFDEVQDKNFVDSINRAARATQK